MERLSMFENFNDIEEKRVCYKGKPVFEKPDKATFGGSLSLFDYFDNIPVPLSIDRYSEGNLKFLARQAINEFDQKELLWQAIEIDIFFWINYTCDYLLSGQGKETISASEDCWDQEFIKEKFNSNVELRDDTIEIFYKNKKRLILNSMIEIDKLFDVIKDKGQQPYNIIIPKLCKHFFLFILNNLKDSPLYDRKGAKYDRYLYKNVANGIIDSNDSPYNFDYSDYYIFEKIIGLNFVTTLSVLLGDYVSIKAAKKSILLHMKILLTVWYTVKLLIVLDVSLQMKTFTLTMNYAKSIIYS